MTFEDFARTCAWRVGKDTCNYHESSPGTCACESCPKFSHARPKPKGGIELSTHADLLHEIAKSHGLDPTAVIADYATLREQGMSGDEALGTIKQKAASEEAAHAQKTEPRPVMEKPIVMEEPSANEYMAEEENLASLNEKSKIATIEVKTAGEIFKDKAKNPDKPTVRIETENGATLNISQPKGMTYADGKWSIHNKLQAHRSTMNKQSKFRAFLQRYKQWPHVGLEVDTSVDPEGFLRIVV